MYHQALQAISGSSFIKTRTGQLELRNQDGEVIYLGKADADAIQEHLSEEHELIRYAVHNHLQTAGVFGSGWHMIPVNSPQLFPNIKPGKASMRV